MTRNSISQKGNLDRETITDLVGLHSDRRDWHFDLWIYIPARFESRNLSTRISSASFEDHRRISIRRPQQVAIPSGPLLFLDVLRHGLWNDVALCEDSKLSAMGIFPDNTKGIVCVVENNINQVFTYQVNDEDAEFMDIEDLHEIKYDNEVISASFSFRVVYRRRAG
jgi:hypothetical protein